jgi:hypothetical protein
MAKQVKCPKCGRPQELSNFCVECGLDFRAYAQRIRERRAAQGSAQGSEATQPPATGLRDIGKLFEDSWAIYKERFATLFILHLLTAAFLLGPVLVLALLGMTAGVMGEEMLGIGAGAGAITGLLIGSVLMFIPMAGLIAALGDKGLGVKDSLRAGYEKLWAFLWLMGLTGFLILGGFILSFIPAVIFFIWFLPAQFIVIIEQERGMSAVMKSRQYVRGQWWGVFGRVLLIMLLSGVAGALPGGSLLFTPFMYIMLYLIYMDLRAEKTTAAPETSGTSDRLWIIIPALLGYLLIAGFIVVAALSEMEEKEYIERHWPDAPHRVTTSVPDYRPDISIF